MRFHMLQNAQMALDFLRYKKIKLVNIRAEDIVDGNPKLTLGLIWTIILHFQVSTKQKNPILIFILKRDKKLSTASTAMKPTNISNVVCTFNLVAELQPQQHRNSNKNPIIY